MVSQGQGWGPHQWARSRRRQEGLEAATLFRPKLTRGQDGQGLAVST